MPGRRRNPNADNRSYNRRRRTKAASQLEADRLAREADAAASERLDRAERARRARMESPASRREPAPWFGGPE